MQIIMTIIQGQETYEEEKKLVKALATQEGTGVDWKLKINLAELQVHFCQIYSVNLKK